LGLPPDEPPEDEPPEDEPPDDDPPIDDEPPDDEPPDEEPISSVGALTVSISVQPGHAAKGHRLGKHGNKRQ